MLLGLAAMYVGKKAIEHVLESDIIVPAAATAVAGAAVVGATAVGAAVVSKESKKTQSVDNNPDNDNNNKDYPNKTKTEKNIPVLLASKCKSCKAGITGYTNEIIKCSYCDTKQNISSSDSNDAEFAI